MNINGGIAFRAPPVCVCALCGTGREKITYRVQFASSVVDGEDVCYVVLGQLIDVLGVPVVTNVEPR